MWLNVTASSSSATMMQFAGQLVSASYIWLEEEEICSLTEAGRPLTAALWSDVKCL